MNKIDWAILFFGEFFWAWRFGRFFPNILAIPESPLMLLMLFLVFYDIHNERLAKNNGTPCA